MFVNILLIMSLSESEQLSWEIAKEIIDNQTTVATWGITILVAVLLFIMAVSWFWNYRLHKREVDMAIEKAIASFKKELAAKQEEDYTKLAEENKNELKGIKQEIEKSLKEELIKFDAEKARLFALVNQQRGAWEQAVTWWAEAIEGYAKTGKEKGIRISVDALNKDLDECKKLKGDYKKKIKKHLSFIPEILDEEKRQIEKKLNKLPKEITKRPKAE